jgi:hypothetical protein
VGTIPGVALGSLKHLIKLYASYNDLSGTIPSELKKNGIFSTLLFYISLQLGHQSLTFCFLLHWRTIQARCMYKEMLKCPESIRFASHLDCIISVLIVEMLNVVPIAVTPSSIVFT